MKKNKRNPACFPWQSQAFAGLWAAALLASLAWGAPRRGSAPAFEAAGALQSAVPSFLAPSDSSADAKTGTRPTPLSKAFKGRLPITELSEDEAILHALNRLGYGPRPGDVDRIRKMGLEKWIDQQLHPDTIDDAALAARLDRYATLTMTTAALVDQYPRPEVAAKRMG